MLTNYVKYIEFLDERLGRFFASQKPYIFCKKGCGKCCQNSQYPYSKLELAYLLEGAKKLDVEVQRKINANVEKILKARETYDGDFLRYDCPFLIDNECCVYEYRGIICRTFGLMMIGDDGGIKAPFCHEQGLNYSNVMQADGKNVSVEKFLALGVKEEPTAFSISYKFLTDEAFEKMFNIEFGEKKHLIEWFVEGDLKSKSDCNNIE